MIGFFVGVNILASIIIFIAGMVSEHVLHANPFKNIVRFVFCLIGSWLSPYFITGALNGIHRSNFLTEHMFFTLLISSLAFICWQLVSYDLFEDLDEV